MFYWFRPAILTVHIVRMFSKDVFVERLCFVKLTQGFVKTGQVVCCSYRDCVIITFISLTFLFAP